MAGDGGSAPREHWTGITGLVLAGSGALIGLGNIWKFPYLSGENGGGAIVLIYLMGILLIGLPFLLCEITMGRSSQRNPVGAFRLLRPATSHTADFIGFGMIFSGIALLLFQSFGWALVIVVLGIMFIRYGWTVAGILAVLSGFLVLGFYSVSGGWVIGYMIKEFNFQIAAASVADAKLEFGNFIENIPIIIALHIIFVLICALIVGGGIKNGIEKWMKFLMPCLFVLLLIFILRMLTLDGASAGINFFLTPDLSKITARDVLTALGQSFFTLGLGMGIMITYGSYMTKEQNIFLSTLLVVIISTAVSILTGLAIFMVVFAQGFDPSDEPGILFQVLPAVLNTIPGGFFWAALLFLMLSIAALAAGVSLLEVLTTCLSEEFRWSRSQAVTIAASSTVLLGIIVAVSVSDWHRVEWLHNALVKTFGVSQDNCFDLLDKLTAQWMLPVSALSGAIFVGWIWGVRKAVEEIRHGSHNFADVHLVSLLAGLKDDPSHNVKHHVWTLAALWGIFIRFITPVAVVAAFLYAVGWIRLN